MLPFDFKNDFKYSNNPLIPEAFLGIDDGEHLHLFETSVIISLTKSIIDIDDYLIKAFHKTKD